MINNQIVGAAAEQSLAILVQATIEACAKLNTLLPEQLSVHVSLSVESLCAGLKQLTARIADELQRHEKSLQNLEANLRKHVKNEIELRIYYEHLEETITRLRKQKAQDEKLISTLKTEVSGLKDKQKYFMTVSNSNTRNNDELGQTMQTKIDTIAKIKNRLSLNGTHQFYAAFMDRRIDRDHETMDLRDKRKSLADSLKKLYETPAASDAPKLAGKQEGKGSKTKSKQKSLAGSRKSLPRSKSGATLSNRCELQKPRRSVKKDKSSIKQSGGVNYTSSLSRRNSKN